MRRRTGIIMRTGNREVIRDGRDELPLIRESSRVLDFEGEHARDLSGQPSSVGAKSSCGRET
jgi:hypothetical protein